MWAIAYAASASAAPMVFACRRAEVRYEYFIARQPARRHASRPPSLRDDGFAMLDSSGSVSGRCQPRRRYGF